MPKALIREVADYCWSRNFLDVFHRFFADHADLFIDAPDHLVAGEHDMKYYNLFQVYLKVYEDTLTEYLSSLSVSIEDFYKEVREYQEDSDEPYIRTFIDCLLASADYESFYKVMVREGKKKAKMIKMIRTAADAKANAASASASANAGANANADSSSGNDSDAKGAGSGNYIAESKGGGSSGISDDKKDVGGSDDKSDYK